MRHHVGSIATYMIGGLLLSGSALYAYVRSKQVVISDERTVLARLEPAPAHDFEWEALGQRAYVSNCQNCHGREGEGWDQYPGLGRSAELAAAPGGREYFLALHLYGLTSPRWRAPMPPMGHIQDVELAAVMNHVLTHFGNRASAAQLYLPADVAAARGQRLSPWDVERLRPRLPTEPWRGRKQREHE